MSAMFDYIIGKTQGEEGRLAASLEHALGCLGTEIEHNADLREQNDRMAVLLERWLNIAVHGTYRDRTKFSLKAHPLTDETRDFLKSISPDN
jgi:hypothetical protein